MRTGVDRLLENIEARGEVKGIIKSAVLLLDSGMTVQEVSERLKLTDEQIKQVEIRAELSMQTA
jgi:DNA-directed RNA polymerase sigma subunit (sigma70/sigma32)